MKRRLLAAGLSAMMVMSMTVASYAASFSDVKADAWYSDVVNKMADQGVINGYPDGTFNPEGVITVAEFTKLTVALVDGTKTAAEGEKWYKPYMDRAAELGILPSGVTEADAEKAISRENMAGIVELTAQKVRNETVFRDDAKIEAVKAKITDYESIGSAYGEAAAEYKALFVNSYIRGLVTGMTATTFVPGANATRAQAATMISRLTDVDSRVNNDQPAAVEEPVVNAEATDLGGAYMAGIKSYLDSIHNSGSSEVIPQDDFLAEAGKVLTIKQTDEETYTGSNAEGKAVIEYDDLDLGTVRYIAADDSITLLGLAPGQTMAQAVETLKAAGFEAADAAQYGENCFTKVAHVCDQGTDWYLVHLEADGDAVKAVTLTITSNYAG